MRTIIAGSRSIRDYALVEAAVRESGFDVTVVLSGKARGVDTLGERWAKEHGVPIDPYPADWIVLGRSAGHVRNLQMARKAEALIAIRDGVSTGTADMIKIATSQGLRLYVKRTRLADFNSKHGHLNLTDDPW